MKLYKGGIFTDHKCEDDRGDQNALLVGYGTENDVDYWIVANTWGKDWGEDGFIRLLRNQNHCGIADTVIYRDMKWKLLLDLFCILMVTFIMSYLFKFQ